MNLLGLAFRNALRNRRRSIVTVLTLAAGYAAVCLFQGYINDINTGMRASAIHSEANGHLVIFKRDALVKGVLDEGKYILSGEELKKLEQLLQQVSGVRLYMPRLEISGLATDGRQSVIFIGQGVEAETYNELRGKFEFTGEGEGISPDAPAGAQIGSGLAELLQLSIGDSGVLFSTTLKNRMNALDFTVRGVFDTGVRETNNKYIIMPLSLARRLYQTDGATMLAVLLESHELVPSAQKKIEALAADAGLDIETRSWEQMSVFYTRVHQLFRSIFLFILVLVITVVGMGVFNTLWMSVLERTREIGALRAIGMRRRSVTVLFCAEALVLSLLAVMLGALLSWAAAAAVNASAVTYQPPGTSGTVELAVLLQPIQLFTNALILVCCALIASSGPALGAARLRITAALAHS